MHFHRFVLAFTFILTLACEAIHLEAAERPNVVFILVDDLGLHDLGVEGSTFYETPNIDGLAKSAMRFSQGYATCRVCSPSRASIQLGQFTARHGITQWIGAKSGLDWNRDDVLLPAEYNHQLPGDDVTLAEAMRDGGYETFFAGKWHLGGDGSLPTDHGFDVNVGGHHRGSPPGGFFSPYKNPEMQDGPAGESLTMRLANETADFVAAPRDKPFFAMLSFYTVHAPVQTEQQRWRKYQKKAKDLGEIENRFEIDRTLPVRIVQDHPVYAGMIETMDDAVGTVLDRLNEAGLNENTIVIFTSDNGGVASGDAYATCNAPLRGGKGRQWEGGIREPFYIKYPPVTGTGATNDTAVTGADFYPTILELCGLDPRPDQHIDGVSLVPLMHGRTIDSRPLYWHYPHYDNQGGEPSSLIRVGNDKLIHYFEDGRNELYDLSKDPAETTDLAPTSPEKTDRLWSQLDGWLKSVDAKIPQSDPRYDPARTAAKWKRAHTVKKQQLETSHAAYHDDDWQPNSTWWNSQAPKD